MDTDEIIRELQSRIDKGGHLISEAILFGYLKDIGKKEANLMHEHQALNKRIMGELVSLRRQVRWYSENI